MHEESLWTAEKWTVDQDLDHWLQKSQTKSRLLAPARADNTAPTGLTTAVVSVSGWWLQELVNNKDH
jgi:hypothetical protein